ncbi:MAG: hypothetical protein JXM73_05355 [Anaerolineae bacterium]|nr:hypothetical protein [Anaerolineae bacterium]
MKNLRVLMLVAIVMAVAIPSAFAQLGDCDRSSFSIQNLGTSQATVTVYFYDEAGTEYQPADLGGGQPNPFTLDPGAQYQVYVPGIPSLADGRYSVVIESTEPVAVIANMIGYTGSCGAGNWPGFNGSYNGFDAGAQPYYMPSIVYDYNNWNSLISIQNVNATTTNVTITIKDPRGNPDRTKSWPNVPAFASVHLDLETEGAGLSLASGLNGSAIITSDLPVAVVDNQTAYGGGNGLTQTYNGFADGAAKFFAPALYNRFPGVSGWRSSINIQNIGAGPTNVTVTFSDGGTPMTCNALAAGASCLLSMVNRTDGPNEFSGVITSDAEDIVAIVNASNPNKKEAQTYSAIPDGSGAATVSFPLVMKSFPGPTGGWDTNFLVQNIGTAACTSVTVDYSDDVNTGAVGPSYTIAGPIAVGAYVSVYQPGDTNLPANWYSGSVAVTCTNGEPLAGIVNETNHINNTSNGDWSMSYNGF